MSNNNFQPANAALPFFAYGIFKPGQLAYPRIKDYVERCQEATVSGVLKERDGIPLLEMDRDGLSINGFLMHFSKTVCDVPYCRIAEIEPQEVYQWAEADTSHGKANVLIGRKLSRGSSELEYEVSWDGSKDPYFTSGLREIDRMILSSKDSNADEFTRLFRLQMAYILLWAAIERYASLKYLLGDRSWEKIKQIAKEDAYKASLEKNVKRTGSVHRASNLDKIVLDPKKPQKSLEYYYQIRSNVVHRGKVVTKDVTIIEEALTELLAIFTDMLDSTFSTALK